MGELSMDPGATRAVAAELRSIARQLGSSGGSAGGGTYAEVAATLARGDAAAHGVAAACDALARGLDEVADGVVTSDRSSGGAGGGGAAVVR